MRNGAPVLVLDGVEKNFREPAGVLRVLAGANLALRAGEIVLLEGPSGSGKTTLLQVAGALRRAEAGRVELAGEELNAAPEAARTRARRERLGFVFQHFHLVDALSARDNIALGLRLRRQPADEARVTATLDALGLAAKAAKLPRDLSGGEKQRVAIGRALVSGPPLLLADEPTSQLDARAAEGVAQLLRAAARSSGAAALIATHDPRLRAIADRVCMLREGLIYE